MKLQLPTTQNPEPLTFDPEILDMVAAKVEDITLPNALLKERAGPRHIARVISDILHNGQSDSMRLRAAIAAAEMGGHDSGREASTISINIVGDVQMNQLFCPTR